MSDLSLQSSHQYWRQYPDPMIYKVLCHMANKEVIQSNHTLVTLSLKELSKTISQATNVDFNKLPEQEALITLANQLNIIQTLSLLQLLDTTRPGAAAHLLMHAENITQDTSDTAGIFLKRNLVFERLRLLGRVFSKERLQLIRSALESET